MPCAWSLQPRPLGGPAQSLFFKGFRAAWRQLSCSQLITSEVRGWEELRYPKPAGPASLPWPSGQPQRAGLRGAQMPPPHRPQGAEVAEARL